ncbi:hypothetical protein JOF56_005737 [Kibdelosporangium banguiense]|uniref:Uncharacterized protein n=1 Tax=Kibdelosporangium banguiense TaxID=1365924 RepID=A0ABS4TLQ1_9PSEU|nr:hypothetical protein [Kibdelosporangium banguiense]MBP2325352.1 hypothetical protein [Kibdelosporangium banguiense]
MTTIHDRHTGCPPAEEVTRDEALAARLEWEASVDQLIQPGQAAITREDGTTELAVVHSLLEQVAGAVLPGNERNGKVSSNASRPPGSLGAVSLLAEIRQEVTRACQGHDEHAQPDTVAERLRLWVGHADSWQHHYPDYVVWAAATTSDWVRQARQLLDPPPRVALRGQTCPVCAACTVQVWSEDDEDFVRQSALAIDPYRVAVVCAGCGQSWGAEIWQQLAATLDRQLRHETLAAQGHGHEPAEIG